MQSKEGMQTLFLQIREIGKQIELFFHTFCLSVMFEQSKQNR